MSNPSKSKLKLKTNRDLLLALVKKDQRDNIYVYVESLNECFPVTAIKFAKNKGQMILEIQGRKV